jgi:hypothetical protein
MSIPLDAVFNCSVRILHQKQIRREHPFERMDAMWDMRLTDKRKTCDSNCVAACLVLLFCPGLSSWGDGMLKDQQQQSKEQEPQGKS